MVDAEKREKVIRGLEICTNPGSCSERCPYYHIEITEGSCDYFLLTDALALLKEQEPRVMTLEELQAIETPWNRNTPPYLWLEDRFGQNSHWMCWRDIHSVVSSSEATVWKQNYGSMRRLWTLQPTPDQMRDTKWEDSSNE